MCSNYESAIIAVWLRCGRRSTIFHTWQYQSTGFITAQFKDLVIKILTCYQFNNIQNEGSIFMPKKSIYFLCTGNSCRSQMAEGWAKKYLGPEWEVRSAGIEAHGLNAKAVKAMAEVGIDISNQTSDIIDNEYLNQATIAVTLCGDAKDRCPVTPPQVKREHWGFEDPAKATGTEDEIWIVFRRVRDEIGDRIKHFAESGQ